MTSSHSEERWDPTAPADAAGADITEGVAGLGIAGSGAAARGGTALEKAAGVVGKRWYAGTIDRMLCENTVKSCMQGDYLVRKSASSSGYVLCVNDNKSAVNYTISGTCVQHAGGGVAGTLQHRSAPSLPSPPPTPPSSSFSLTQMHEASCWLWSYFCGCASGTIACVHGADT